MCTPPPQGDLFALIQTGQNPRAGAAHLAELPFCPEVPVDTSATSDTAQIGPFRVGKPANFLPHQLPFYTWAYNIISKKKTKTLN